MSTNSQCMNAPLWHAIYEGRREESRLYSVHRCGKQFWAIHAILQLPFMSRVEVESCLVADYFFPFVAS